MGRGGQERVSNHGRETSEKTHHKRENRFDFFFSVSGCSAEGQMAPHRIESRRVALISCCCYRSIYKSYFAEVDLNVDRIMPVESRGCSDM